MTDVGSFVLNNLAYLAHKDLPLKIEEYFDPAYPNARNMGWKISVGPHAYVVGNFNEGTLLEAYANISGKIQLEESQKYGREST